MIKHKFHNPLVEFAEKVEATNKKLLSNTSMVICGLILSCVTVIQFYTFVDSYRVVFQSPVQIQFYSPVLLQKREVTVVKPTDTIKSPLPSGYEIPSPTPTKTPTPTPRAYKQSERPIVAINRNVSTHKLAIVQSSKYAQFVNHIWVNESSQGTNTRADSLMMQCFSTGRSNEFGFYPSGKWCWDTFEQGVARLEKWREVDAKGLTENQALCYYNGAGKVEECPYLNVNNLSFAH